MPTISMFYGIVIQMYNRNELNPPHFHAIHGENKASFTFDGAILDGNMTKRDIKLISAWCELHYDELMANWSLAMNKEKLYRIEPLK